MLLYQEENGYCYNSDTLFLYDFVSNFKPKDNLLDIGCGCGILGLLIARDFKVNLHQIDKQKHNIELVQKNAHINAIESYTVYHDFINYDFQRQFDFIVSNPPYYSSDVVQTKNKLINISRYNHHLPISDFFAKVNKTLKQRGNFIFCYDAKQIQDVLFYLRKYQLNIENMRFVHNRQEKNASLVLIQAKKGSKSEAKIWSPLIVFDSDIETNEVKEIYHRARTHSIKCKIL